MEEECDGVDNDVHEWTGGVEDWEPTRVLMTDVSYREEVVRNFGGGETIAVVAVGVDDGVELRDPELWDWLPIHVGLARATIGLFKGMEGMELDCINGITGMTAHGAWEEVVDVVVEGIVANEKHVS